MAAASDRAQADLKTAAQAVGAANSAVEAALRAAEAADARRDAKAQAAAVAQAEKAARNLVIANAKYDKQVQIVAILQTAEKILAQAREAKARGDAAGAAKYTKDANALAAVLKNMKVPVSVPTFDEGLSGLGFSLKSVGSAVKKAAGAVQKAASAVQKNAGKIGGTVGGAVSLVPGVGQIVGPAIIAAGAVVQATAPKPKPPKITVDPAAAQPAASNMDVVTDPRTGAQYAVPRGVAPSAGLGLSQQNLYLLLGAGALAVLAIVLSGRRAPAYPPYPYPPPAR